jgi:hypothetical protein
MRKRLPVPLLAFVLLLYSGALLGDTCFQCIAQANLNQIYCQQDCDILSGLARANCYAECFHKWEIDVENCCIDHNDCANPGPCNNFGCSCGNIFEAPGPEPNLPPC